MLAIGPFSDQIPEPKAIHKSRMEAGLTQAQAAWFIGVNAQTWNNWEQPPGSARSRPMSPHYWFYWLTKLAYCQKRQISIRAHYAETHKRRRRDTAGLWAQ